MKPFNEHEDYSLNMLSDWVKESLESSHTPQQVYETIVRAVREKRDYHETCYNHSKKLLELLKGELTPLPEHYDDFECPVPKQETITFSGQDGSAESLRNWENFWYDENHLTFNSSLQQEVDRIGKEGGYEWTPGT
jgi:hypothetical protein